MKNKKLTAGQFYEKYCNKQIAENKPAPFRTKEDFDTLMQAMERGEQIVMLKSRRFGGGNEGHIMELYWLYVELVDEKPVVTYNSYALQSKLKELEDICGLNLHIEHSQDGQTISVTIKSNKLPINIILTVSAFVAVIVYLIFKYGI